MLKSNPALSIVLVFPPLMSLRSLDITTIMPPQGISLLAAVLSKKGYNVSLIDMNLLSRKGFGWQAFEERLIKLRPDVLGITSTTPAVPNVFRIADIAKRVNPLMRVIVGGPYPSGAPEGLLRMHAGIDATVFGEGEETFPEMLARIKEGRSFEGINGVAYRCGDNIRVNPQRAPISDLDQLPFPDRSLLPPLTEYYFAGHCYERLPVTSVVTSRGCPQHCDFCSQGVFGHLYRARSPGSVLEEMLYLKKDFAVRSIMFVDETFTADRERVLELCGLISARNPGLSWLCYAGVNEVDEFLLRAMKKAGCFQVYYGIESGVARILQQMNKKVSREQIISAVNAARSAGLQVRGQFMFNYATQTLTDLKQDAAFARELKLDYAEFSVFFPLPGSPAFARLAHTGRVRLENREDFDIFEQGTSLFLDPIVSFGEYSLDQLRAFTRQAYRDFYLRPEYLLKRLLGIRNINDLRKNWEAFRAVTAGMKAFYAKKH